jgi:membrane protease YdiL (CAAX protease family)
LVPRSGRRGASIAGIPATTAFIEGYARMTAILLTGLLAPVLIAVGLLGFKNVQLTFLLYQGIYCIGIPVADLVFIRRLSAAQIGERLGVRFGRKPVFQGIVIGAAVMISMTAFFVLLRNVLIDPDAISSLLRTWRVGRDQLLIFLIVMAFANPVVEELYWRGYFFDRLKSRLPTGRSAVLSSFFYASYHFVTTCSLFNLKIGVLFTTVIFGAGVFWGILRERSGSVIGPIVIHMLADWAVMIAYFLYIHDRLG